MIDSALMMPCGIFLFVFFCGFGLSCWIFKATYINSLTRRIEWLEDQVAEPEPLTYQARVVRTRYIPIERRTM